MPVIKYIPVDPFDIVIQGDIFRTAAMKENITPITLTAPFGFSTPITEDDETNFGKYIQAGNRDILRNPFDGTMVANNSCIFTPCGALVILNSSRTIINNFIQASILWAISGVTKDSSGSALPNCTVTILETGRMGLDNIEGTVNSTTSDGSGNYSVNVAMNTAHQLIAYKAGGTDVAGVTRNDVTPIAIG